MSEFFAGVISGVFSWNLLIVLFSLGIISDFYSNRFFCSLFAILAVVSSVYFSTEAMLDSKPPIPAITNAIPAILPKIALLFPSTFLFVNIKIAHL